ncbi:MAG TPA: hypothetical protein VK824_01950, partial [Planctomycetota bacterium]|nr:hypothetical protein [Planctomycetota bacterium]
MTSAEADAGFAVPLVVPLHSRRRRRAQAVQGLQHTIPAAGLLFAGMQGLAGGGDGTALALALTEVVTSVALLATVLRSLRNLRGMRRAAASRTSAGHDAAVSAPAAPTPGSSAPAAHAPSAHASTAHGGEEHHSIDWADIWAACVLLAEAWHRWHEEHHVARPALVLAAVTAFLALNHGRLTRRMLRRRALTLTDDQLSVGGRGWTRFRVAWPQLAEISVGEREARLRSAAGVVRRIDLADLENEAAVRVALQAAQRHLASRLHAAPAAPVTPVTP